MAHFRIAPLTLPAHSRLTLRERFCEYFEILPADSEKLKREAYKLRHQVYCVETGFEREQDCKILIENGQVSHLETDAYDTRSVHYLIRHRRTGMCAATVRLVLPDFLDPLTPYPMEEHCILKEPVIDPMSRYRLAEISRLAVSKHFKRRQGTAGSIPGIMQGEERRILPHMTIGLFAAIVRMTRAHGITRWYAVMEPALLRLLRLFGIHFVPIGPDVHYHGIRRPCLAEVDRVLPNIRRVNPEVWDLITDGGRYA